MLDRFHQRAVGFAVGLVEPLERGGDGGRMRGIQQAVEVTRKLVFPEAVLGPAAGIGEAQRSRNQRVRIR
jgi:hypothetical protein